MKEETEISSDQNPVDPLFNFIDIENVKLEADLLNFENAEKVEPTSDVESSSIVQENWESETKPCNVSLERCKVVSIRYKNEVVSDGTINSVQDTSENKKTKLPAKKIVINPS